MVMNLTKAQKNRMQTIKERWMKFVYRGQADYDVRFLLRMITGEDPNNTSKRIKDYET